MKRRDFLKTGAAVVAAASVSLPASAEPSAAEQLARMDSMMKGRMALRGAYKRIILRLTPIDQMDDAEYFACKLYSALKIPPEFQRGLGKPGYVRVEMKDLLKGDQFRMYEPEIISGVDSEGLFRPYYEPANGEDRLYTASCDAFRRGRDGGYAKLRDMHPDEPAFWGIMVEQA